MKKKTRTMRKVLLTVFSAMLLVCVTIGATVAYLTSTATVENTFTVGKVKITMDEAAVNTDGTPMQGVARRDNNKYHLLPGHEYTKDPTIHIDDESENAYLGVKVVLSNMNATDTLLSGKYEEVLEGFDKTKWNISSVKDTENDTRIYTLIYNQQINGKTPDIVLFNAVKVPGTLTNEQLADLQDTTMTITAYAVQADGFSDAKTALHTAFSSEF